MVVVLAQSACKPPADPTDWFVDIAPELGLLFHHTSGVGGKFLLPEVMGSGLAVFDYDGDGDLDVYLVNADGDMDTATGNRLFRQDADGVFRDATRESGTGDTGYGMGAAIGDIDNDGDLDLLVTNDGPNRLYRNNADGTFSDITESAGIEGARWSTSAAFCDIDEDGLLDLYVANYVTNEPPYACASGTGEPDYCGPNAYRGVTDRLYRNNGAGFVDISATSGIGQTARNGLGVVCFDFDGDARDDFLVANDGERNQLWMNEGDGTFVDRGVRFGIATNIEGATEASMGIALGDVDGDLRLDALMTHLSGETNTLYLADPLGMLLDSSALSGVGFPSVADTGFGVALADLDQDADLDLAVANGRVQRGTASTAPPSGEAPMDTFRRLYAERNLFMVNNGQGWFDDHCEATPAFCATTEVSRGLLTADVDADGDLDILVTNANGPARLYRNDIPEKGNWLKLRVADPVTNRDAIGATVRVRLGDTWQARPLIHATSYLSSADAQVHFGLGPAEAVDEIEVIWPDGAREQFPGIPANWSTVIRKGTGRGDGA
ncbi:MAG: CRTAC1 family protein [Gammaproteobacteria bacterium]|nr:CRTAC1 family protein [Gammaproteobacteria bacterium]